MPEKAIERSGKAPLMIEAAARNILRTSFASP
jgi:hypothetical protein